MTQSFVIPQPFGPLNRRDSEIQLGQKLPGALVDLLNMDYYESGLKTREGYMAYSGVLASGLSVTALYRYEKKDQSSILLSICGTQLFKEGSTPGSFSTLQSGLTADRLWDFITLADLCIGVNGIGADAFKYDGATIYPLALSPPATEPALSVAGTGVLTGDYQYKVSFISRWGAESNPGPASSTLSAAAENIGLANVPTGSGDIARRKLYRTKAGGTVFYLLDTINDNTTTSYTDTTSDLNLGTDLAPFNHDPPPGGEMLTVWKEYLWMVDLDNPTRAWHSHQGYPEIFNTDEVLGYFVNVGLNDGEAIIGVMPLGATLFFFKENSTWPVTGDLPDDFRVAPEPVNGSVGLYHRSMTRLPDGNLIGLHRSGVYVFNGFQYAKLTDRPSDSIQNIIEGLNPMRLDHAVGYYDQAKDRYLLSVTEAGQSFNNKMLVWDRLRDRWTIYDLKANGMVRWTDQILFASSQNNGTVYKMGGLNDNGTAISVRAEWPWWGLWDAMCLKLIRHVQLDLTAQGDYEPEIAVYLNGESKSYGIHLNEGSDWGSGRWRLDGGTYRIKRTVKVNQKGVYYLKIVFSHGGLNQPVSLNSLAVLGALSERLVV